MSDEPLRFNPDPVVQVVTFPDGTRCVVVDEAVLEPERWRALAAARRGHLVPLPDAWPRVAMRTPEPQQTALAEYFRLRIRRHFPMRRMHRARARFSLLVRGPEPLPRAPLPRRGLWADQPDDRAVVASVLYLFDDPGFGGTVFYTPRDAVAPATALGPDAGAHDRDAGRGFAGDVDAHFRTAGHVDAHWNRMVFHDGRQWHADLVPDPARLADDPLRGRLTLEGFFSGRAAAR